MLVWIIMLIRTSVCDRVLPTFTSSFVATVYCVCKIFNWMFCVCSSETRGNCEAPAFIPLYVIVIVCICSCSCIEMSMQLSIFRNMGVSWGHQRGVVQMYSFN